MLSIIVASKDVKLNRQVKEFYQSNKNDGGSINFVRDGGMLLQMLNCKNYDFVLIDGMNLNSPHGMYVAQSAVSRNSGGSVVLVGQGDLGDKPKHIGAKEYLDKSAPDFDKTLNRTLHNYLGNGNR